MDRPNVSPADLEKFFELSLDLCCIADMDGYFRRVNPAFGRVLGWEEEELLSRPFIDFVHPDDVEATEREVARLAEGMPTVSFENRYRRVDGRYVDLRWAAFPDASSRAIYAIATDMTATKRANAVFREALEAAPSAVLLVDPSGRIRLVNRGVEEMLGYSRDELIGAPLERLVPERFREVHREHVEAYLDDGSERMMGQGRDLVAVRADGEEIPVEIGLSAIETPAGRMTLALMLDIRVRKQMEQTLLRTSERTRALLRALPDLIFRVDREGNVLESFGDAAGWELDQPPASYVGHNASEILSESQAPEALAQISAALEEEGAVVEEYRIDVGRGEQVYEVRMVGIEDETVLAIIRNITDQTRALEELQRAREHEQYLARHDALTGLPNRRLFYDTLTRAVGRAERHESAVGVFFLDLDGFKEVNDELGHEAGDRLLKQVAERLKASVRKNDVIARLGGDEFTVAAEDVDSRDDLIPLAEKIAARIREPFELPEGTAQVSASVGISTFPGDGDDPDTLVRHADAAMYAAKRGGKDTYRFYRDIGGADGS